MSQDRNLRETAIKLSKRDGCSVRFIENETGYIATNGVVRELDRWNAYECMGYWIH
jgi:hypothetical protein